jgi:hypothetical protein
VARTRSSTGPPLEEIPMTKFEIRMNAQMTKFE